jgi:hypothetical protein
VEITKVSKTYRVVIPEKLAREAADVIYAATCLQSRGVLDYELGDLGRIKDSGVIEVWSIGEATRNSLIQEQRSLDCRPRK